MLDILRAPFFAYIHARIGNPGRVFGFTPSEMAAAEATTPRALRIVALIEGR